MSIITKPYLRNLVINKNKIANVLEVAMNLNVNISIYYDIINYCTILYTVWKKSNIIT